nr:DUF5643 domain-containing protein [Bacillus cereus]
MNVTSLAKVEGKIRKFTPNIKTLTKDNLYALTVDKVNFSSLSTRIDLTFDYSKVETNDSWQAFDYTVTDDKGKIYEGGSLQVGSTGLYGHHIFWNRQDYGNHCGRNSADFLNDKLGFGRVSLFKERNKIKLWETTLKKGNYICKKIKIK